MLPYYEQLTTHELSTDLRQAELIPDPVGIGAVGGSGTRLVAEIVAQAGLVPASPLNRAGDAMEWPPFKRLLTPAMEARYDRDVLLNNIFAAFEKLLVDRRERLGSSGRVNWKVPGTFFWLRELSSYFPRMQYIHLIRNGLDMAYSGNQNQIANWAPHLDIAIEYEDNGKIRPRAMLEYWLAANEHALCVGRECLGERMLTVRFEDLCTTPTAELERILQFLGFDLSPSEIAPLSDLVKIPDSFGRYKKFNWKSDFTAAQFSRLEQLGYKG